MSDTNKGAVGSVDSQPVADGSQHINSPKSIGASDKAGNSALPSSAARSNVEADPKAVNAGATTSNAAGSGVATRGQSPKVNKRPSTPPHRGAGKGTPGHHTQPKGTNGNARNLERPREGRPSENPTNRGSGNAAPQGKTWKGKSADQKLNSQIAQAMCEYRDTAWYEKAVKQGFKNKAALDKFNAVVTAKSDSIDPRYAPVCSTCGHSDLTICDCLITAKANAVADDDDVISIPQGSPNFRYEWNWVGRIKRMFSRPNFDSAAPVNHNIGFLDNSELLGQEMLWGSLLAYLRMNANTSYCINGVYDRNQKLAHMKKLSLRYFQEMNVPPKDRLNPLFVNKVHHTVQVACDMPDDEFLLREVEMRHNITSFFNARTLWRWRYVWIAGLACLSPTLVSSAVNVSQRIHQWIFVRLTITNARILAFGSVSAVGSLAQIVSSTAPVIVGNIYAGIVRPCYITIQQSLCSIARTMSSRASSTDISRILPSQTTSTGASLIGLSTEWLAELQSRIFRSTMRAI